MKRLTIYEIKEMLSNINKNIKILDNVYINNHTKLKCKCLIDNHEWETAWNNIKAGRGCPKCAISLIKNKISVKRPDLIKYLKDKNDAELYTFGSSASVRCVCPNCGYERDVIVSQLSTRGLSCKHCSDGISIPEKFCINLLKELNVNFIKEYKPSWSNNKRYDIYIPSINIIIEIHGKQHYEESTLSKNSLKLERNNDKLKKELAIKNGIEKYIEIDCRKSDFNWLKINFEKSLKNILEFNNLDFEKIWKESQKSILYEVCEYWNNRKKGETTPILAKLFNINRRTVLSYLKVGHEIGLCKYDKKNEFIEAYSKRFKKVYQFDLNWNFIAEFDSARIASNGLKTTKSCIANCCSGRVNSAGGYKWSYEKNPNVKLNKT